MQVKWLQFLSEVGHNDSALSPELHADVEIQAALKLVEITTCTAEQIEVYHAIQDKLRIEPTALADAQVKGEVNA